MTGLGLRQRRQAKAAAAGGGDEDAEDDNTVGRGEVDVGGCPLYVVLCVGLFMFLLGWLVPS